MEKPLTENELKEIASQLSHPQGKSGIDMAEKMNESNIKMTLKTIEAIIPVDNDIVLELGHGNCGHLKHILDYGQNIQYYGLEISKLMHQEGQKFNSEYVSNNQASFHLYDGLTIPFEEGLFNKVLTVNTIYFWRNPGEMLKEIYRVLKSKGRFGIGFAQKSFMETLPFTKYGFELYDTDKVKDLVKDTDFKVVDVSDHKDHMKSKTGEMLERDFTVMVLAK